MDGLNPLLSASLERLGYTQLTAIQLAAIPVAMEGKDFYATSPTGTGKTAAFLVPIIERILEAGESGGVRALILEPTRELAIQAANECRKLSAGMGIITVAAYGGTDPARQDGMVEKGAQVVIGTPGRIGEMIGEGRLKPGQFCILVLDEADRLFGGQFAKQVTHIASRLNPSRQTMLFSVQMQKEFLEQAAKVMKPGFLRVHKGKVSGDTVEHSYVLADNAVRTLANLIRGNPSKSLVFCATSKVVESVSKELALMGVRAIMLHSHMKSGRRHSALRRFKDGSENVLACTDVVSRGIHVLGVDRVYSVGLPPTPEFYVHRAGRTGRMNRRGECVSIIPPADEKKLKAIYESIGATGKKR